MSFRFNIVISSYRKSRQVTLIHLWILFECKFHYIKMIKSWKKKKKELICQFSNFSLFGPRAVTVHYAQPSRRRCSTPSPAASSPAGSPARGRPSPMRLFCSGPGSPPHLSGSDAPKTGHPQASPHGSHGDGRTVPWLLGDGRALWYADAAWWLLWTDRWWFLIKDAPCRKKGRGYAIK